MEESPFADDVKRAAFVTGSKKAFLCHFIIRACVLVLLCILLGIPWWTAYLARAYSITSTMTALTITQRDSVTNAPTRTRTFVIGDPDSPPAVNEGFMATLVLVSFVLVAFVLAAVGSSRTFIQLRSGRLPLSDAILKAVFGLDLVAGALLVVSIAVYSDAANRFLGFGASSGGATDDEYSVEEGTQFAWSGGFFCAVVATVGLCAQPWPVLWVRWRQRRLMSSESEMEEDGGLYTAQSAEESLLSPPFVGYDAGEAGNLERVVATLPECDPADGPGLAVPRLPVPEAEDRQAAYANRIF